MAAAAEGGETDVDTSHLAGWILVVGAVAFGVGAGDPYLVRAWTAPQEPFLAIVARHPLAWRVTHILFIGGTVLTAAGLAMLPLLMPEGWPRGLAVTPTTARVFAETRALDPWVATLDRLSGGLFKGFIVIAFAGLGAIGIATTAGGPIPGILGWGSAALSGLLVAGLFVAGDMPPFTVYIAPLAFGVALVLGL